MSDTERHSLHDFSEYDAMSTEELEALLRQDSENEAGESDPEQLLCIMEVLSNRTVIPKSPEKALCSFRKQYDPVNDAEATHRKALPGLHRFATIAAILVLVVMAALPARSICVQLWEDFATWSEEVFHFGTDY